MTEKQKLFLEELTELSKKYEIEILGADIRLEAIELSKDDLENVFYRVGEYVGVFLDYGD